MVTEARAERQLWIQYPLEHLAEGPAVEQNHHALGRDRLPVGVAHPGHGVAKNVLRLLAHAQVRDHEAPINDVGAHEVVSKPAQPLHGPDIARLDQGLRVRRLGRKRDIALVDDQGIESFGVAFVGEDHDPPEQ